MEFSKDLCRQLRSKLQAAIASVEKEMQVKLSVGSMKYTSNTVQIKVDGSCAIGAGGKVISKEAATFKQYAGLLGLKPSDLGRQFKTFSGKTFQIIGADLRKRKYPIIGEDVATGKRYKFTEQQAQQGLTTTTR